MATILGQASIVLTANTASFESGISDARDTARSAFGDIRQQATDMGNQMRNALGVAAAATGALSASVGVLVKEQMELVDALTKTARLANTTVTDIQKYTLAAKSMGLEVDNLGDIFKDVQDKVGDFLTTDGGELADFFKLVSDRVGVSAEQFRTLSGPDALQLYYDSLEKANVSQSEMVFYLEGIASDASLLIPLLKNGGEGFEFWEETARKAGAVMDEKTIRATQELNAATDLLNLSWQGAKNQFTQAIIPVLGDVAENLVGSSTAADTARVAGEKLVVGLKALAKVGVGVATVFQTLGTAVGGFAAGVSVFFNSIDTSDPLSFIMSLGRANTAAAHVFDSTLSDINSQMIRAGTVMNDLDRLGTGLTNERISRVLELKNAQEQLNKVLGETGRETAEKKKAEEEAKKAAAKANASAKAALDKSNPFVSNGELVGLSIKSKEATAGGQVRQATAEFARVAQELVGSNLKYFSAFNDKYHQGRVSDHNKGMAFDVVLKDAKQSRLVSHQLQETARQLGYDIKVLNEYVKPSKYSTGGHIHASIKGYANEKSNAKSGINGHNGYILPSEKKAWDLVLANAQKYDFAKYEQMYNLPAGLLSAVHMQESKGDVKARSGVGAEGGYQIMPRTAKDLGLKQGEAYDMTKATPAAAKYLKQLIDRYHGNVDKALAAYNAGMGNVDKYGGVPPFKETRGYVRGVNRYRSAMDGGNAVKEMTANQWLAQTQKSEEEAKRQAQKEADARLSVEKYYADEKTKALYELQARQKEIVAANYGKDEHDKYMILAQAQYENKLALIDLAKDKQIQSANEYLQTEEERIIATANLERRTVALTLDMSEELRHAKIDAINHAEMVALSTLRLEQDKTWQAVNEQYQTEEERIKAHAELERREIMAIVGMDEKLREAKIKAVTDKELKALNDIKNAYRNELNELTSHNKTELQKLRDEFKNKRYALNDRTDISSEQKWELSNAMDGQEIHAIKSLQDQARQNKAMFYAEMGGVSELQNIETQQQARLDTIQGFLDAEVMTVEEAEKAKELIRMQYAQDMLGNLTESSKAAFGEQSSAYKAMFAMQKGMAITHASIALWQNISEASKIGFPQNIPMIAQAMTQGMGIITNIKSIKSTVVGQAHDGIMSVPKSGTWNLEKGERVLPKHTAQNLDRTLNNIQGGNGKQVIINQHITINASGTSDVKQDSNQNQIGQALKQGMVNVVLGEMKQGGAIYNFVKNSR